MPLAEWFHWLHNTAFASGIRQSDIWFPVIEGTHILALSISVGLILMLDLRLLGISFGSVPVSKVMAGAMNWALPGFVVMFVTGILLFVAQADKVWNNRFFLGKMAMLVLLGVNALYYQRAFYPQMDRWPLEKVPPGAMRAGAVSLILWAAVIACGRLMAYEL